MSQTKSEQYRMYSAILNFIMKDLLKTINLSKTENQEFP